MASTTPARTFTFNGTSCLWVFLLGCLVPAARASAVAVPSPGGLGGPHHVQEEPMNECSNERQRMLELDLAGRDIEDQRVLEAMSRVPREAFMRGPSCIAAYADSPAPIGSGQTISQPYIVAYMSQAVAPQPNERCLEVGTGSGYQAAILAELCEKVYSIEVIPELGDFARDNLRAADYGDDRVALRIGDGYNGWPEEAPFDVILVTAAPPQVPRPLLEQLAPGGRLVAPIGPDGGLQELVLYRRIAGEAGTHQPEHFERRRLLPVRFVPFVGKAQEGEPPPRQDD